MLLNPTEARQAINRRVPNLQVMIVAFALTIGAVQPVAAFSFEEVFATAEEAASLVDENDKNDRLFEETPTDNSKDASSPASPAETLTPLPPPLMAQLKRIENLSARLEEQEKRLSKQLKALVSINPKGLMQKKYFWRKLDFKICFIHKGLERFSKSRRKRIFVMFVKAASEWKRQGSNKLTLDFGPRKGGFHECKPGEKFDIRVGFKRGGGSWSYVGRDVLNKRHKLKATDPTMNIDLKSNSIKRIRMIMRHEFGHALGLEHEHQNPKDNSCHKHLDLAKLKDDFKKRGYDKVDIVDRYIKTLGGPRIWKTPYDRKSVMHYRFLPRLIKPAGRKKCVQSSTNFSLSDRDKSFIANRYQ